MERNRELEKLKKKVEKCKECPLWKTRKKVVFGEGTGKIMIVGQAPGKEENLTGKPFVGRAGKLLSSILEKNEMRRKNFFITSVLKCFPPRNRKPKAMEIKSCLPYLKKQIEIINPRFIFLLGEVATKSLFGKKFSEARGKAIKYGKKTYFITFHPAAALRSIRIRKKFENDIKKFLKIIKRAKGNNKVY